MIAEKSPPVLMTGFMRLSQIIGQDPVTEEEARKNRIRGKGPRRPRRGITPLIPVKKSSWWEGVRAGRYPKPEKLGPRTTVWRVEDILELLADFAPKQAVKEDSDHDSAQVSERAV